jgi:hypothetical protein
MYLPPKPLLMAHPPTHPSTHTVQAHNGGDGALLNQFLQQLGGVVGVSWGGPGGAAVRMQEPAPSSESAAEDNHRRFSDMSAVCATESFVRMSSSCPPSDGYRASRRFIDASVNLRDRRKDPASRNPDLP